MASRRFWLAFLLAGSGCQLLPGFGTQLGSTGAGGSPPATGGGTAEMRAAPATEPATPNPEPLRDPRERRLRHVRQLTRSRWVAMPHFSADGKWIYVAEKRAKEVVLLRVSATDPAKAIEEVPASDPRGLLWGLAEGKGALCAVSSQRPCPDGGWPDTEALLSCGGLSLSPLRSEAPATSKAPGAPGDAKGAGCPAARGALPCALAATGGEVCPELVADGGVRLALWKPSAAAAIPFGPATGNSWMPSLSRNGSRLVFVTQPSAAVSHLMVSFIDRPDSEPEPIGPEAARTLDPTFTPAGDRVVFASTADDAAGQELELMLVGIIGGALERITFSPGIDRFPVFSPDGHSIAWVSERAADAHAQDLVIAEWVEP